MTPLAKTQGSTPSVSRGRGGDVGVPVADA